MTLQSEAGEVAQLACRDDDSDAAREPHGHRVRDMTDEASKTAQADEREENAGHHHDHHQPVDAVPGDRRRHQHDEGAGGTTDLDAAAAQGRDEKAADDGRI